MTYKFGDIIDFPKTEQKRVRIGSNEFINLSVPNKLTTGEYAKYQRKFPGSKGPIVDIGDWHSNPNWLNYYNKRTLYSSEFHIQNSARQQCFASNGKSGADRLLCYIGDSTTYDAIIGNYDGLFTHYNMPVEMRAVMYYSPTDTWFFSASGEIYTISDADLKTGGSLTQIPGTPVSGFDASTSVLYHVKRTGTIIHTSDNNEIARSIDHGVTWTNVGASTSGDGRGMIEDASGNLVLITNSATSYKSTDDGLTWSPIPVIDSTSTTNYTVDCNKETGRFIWSADRTHIYTIDDINGSQRLLHTFPLIVHAVRCINNVWYATQDAKDVGADQDFGYMSFDDGETWIAIKGVIFKGIYNAGGFTWVFNDNDENLVISQRYLDAVTVVTINTEDGASTPVYYSDTKGKVKLFCVR
jgi:hypothetical protein